MEKNLEGVPAEFGVGLVDTSVLGNPLHREALIHAEELEQRVAAMELMGRSQPTQKVHRARVAFHTSTKGVVTWEGTVECTSDGDNWKEVADATFELEKYIHSMHPIVPD